MNLRGELLELPPERTTVAQLAEFAMTPEIGLQLGDRVEKSQIAMLGKRRDIGSLKDLDQSARAARQRREHE